MVAVRRVKARCVPRPGVDDLRRCGGESCLVYLRGTQVKLRRELLMHAASAYVCIPVWGSSFTVS